MLLFTADDGVHGMEPWRDRDNAPTLVQDLAPGPTPSSPLSFTASGAFVYFAANDGVHGFEPWRLRLTPFLSSPTASSPATPAGFRHALTPPSKQEASRVLAPVSRRPRRYNASSAAAPDPSRADDPHPTSLEIPETEVSFATSRSSGPGGQNVNKVESRVTLLFDLAASPSLSDEQRRRVASRLATRINKAGVLRVVAQQHRTQAANREAALARFADLLAGALRPRPPRRQTRPPAAAARRLAAKRRKSRLKELRRGPAMRADGEMAAAARADADGG